MELKQPENNLMPTVDADSSPIAETSNNQPPPSPPSSSKEDKPLPSPLVRTRSISANSGNPFMQLFRRISQTLDERAKNKGPAPNQPPSPKLEKKSRISEPALQLLELVNDDLEQINKLGWEILQKNVALTNDTIMMLFQDNFLWSNVIQEWCFKGIEPKHRSFAWKFLISCKSLPLGENLFFSSEIREHFKICLEANLETSHSDQIWRDIKRTFPKNVVIRIPSVQNKLFNVLKANAVFNREVGYCQGMADIAGFLLFQFDEAESFMVIHELCQTYEMHDIWKPGLPGTSKAFYIVDKLISATLPAIHKHFQRVNLSSSTWCTPWLITLFLHNFRFEVVMRIWDILLFDGFWYFYCVVLAILKLYEMEILKLGFEDLVWFLQFENKTGKSNDDVLEEPMIDIEKLLLQSQEYRKSMKENVSKLEKEFIELNRNRSKSV